MAVTYDNSAGFLDFGTDTVGGNITVGSGDDRVAMLCLATLAAPGEITVSLGGVPGTAVAGAAGNDGTWWLTLFKVLDPPSGSQAASASWENATSAYLAVVTATGADDVDGGEYAQAAANNVSLEITSASGDLTASFSADQNTGTTHSTNQTIRISGALVGADTGGGTGTTTHTWTHTGAFACNAVGANFTAAGAAPPATGRGRLVGGKLVGGTLVR